VALAASIVDRGLDSFSAFYSPPCFVPDLSSEEIREKQKVYLKRIYKTGGNKTQHREI